jgi:hypothetical protein
MHRVNSIQFANAQQAKAVYNYKNTKENLCNTIAATWIKKCVQKLNDSLLST